MSVRLAGTRWLKGYVVIRTHLEHVKETQKATPEVTGRATFLVKKLRDF